METKAFLVYQGLWMSYTVLHVCLDFDMFFSPSLLWQNATFPLNHQGYVGYPFSSLPQPPQLIAHSAENLQRLPEQEDYPFSAPVHLQAESSSSDEKHDALRSNRDSFYESDEDASPRYTPVRPVTTPRTHIHKNMASGSYENDSVVLSLQQQQQAELAVDQTTPVPQPRSLLPDYENLIKTTQAKSLMDSKFGSESPRSVSPMDYENALPTYEEATAGDVDDMFTSAPQIPEGPPPPVPLRSESHEQQYSVEEVIPKDDGRVETVRVETGRVETVSVSSDEVRRGCVRWYRYPQVGLT